MQVSESFVGVGDVREILPQLDAGSVDMCVTSPPYFGLRDYGTGTWTGGDPECGHVVGEMRRGLANSAASTRGAGTTGLVAEKHGRSWIGVELNEGYARMAVERIKGAQT